LGPILEGTPNQARTVGHFARASSASFAFPKRESRGSVFAADPDDVTHKCEGSTLGPVDVNKRVGLQVAQLESHVCSCAAFGPIVLPRTEGCTAPNVGDMPARQPVVRIPPRA